MRALLCMMYIFKQQRARSSPGRRSCRLQQLEPLKMSIVDESGGEESKFMITIVSKSFEGLTLLKRHRSVYGLMADEMKIVHAVTLDTKTPEEVGM